ncbi:unnamed protein product [Musa acuminata subsp. malaccensis]|nr:unnamed protein product [Musa acuminata subsp. malaccensis]
MVRIYKLKPPKNRIRVKSNKSKSVCQARNKNFVIRAQIL